MAVEKLSVIVPSDDLDASVRFWRALAGEPTFVDGERWAQFDLGPYRVSVGAGTERPATTTVMAKVDDLDATVAELRAAGVAVGEVVAGAHERRAELTGPGGERVVLYTPLGR